MERMVTLADLEKYPELRYKGVSLNQLFDFQYLEQADTDNQYQQPIPQQSIQTPEGTVTTIHVPNNVHEHRAKEPVARPPVVPPTKKQEAKKVAPVKKAEVKKEAAKKPVPVKAAKVVKAPAKVVPVKKVVQKKAAKKVK